MTYRSLRRFLRRHLLILLLLKALLLSFVSFNVYRLLQRTSRSRRVPDKRIVLSWTPFIGRQRDDFLDGCPFADRCEWTYDRDALWVADAVVFHAWDLMRVNTLPEPTFDGQKFVFFVMEAPVNSLLFLMNQPKNFYHWTMTYLKTSDVVAPYGGPWVAPAETREMGLDPVKLDFHTDDIMRDKQINGALWLVSQCKTYSKREIAIDALSRHFRVDIVGRCAKNDSLRDLCPKGESCEDLFRRYYFYVAVENAVCKDYISEKYWHRYHLPLVPIVMRRRVYEKHLPPKSFIAMDDYATPREMASHLTQLMEDPEAYMEYFYWRWRGWALQPVIHNGLLHDPRTVRWPGPCNLCKKLLEQDARSRKQSTKEIPDAATWFLQESECEDGTFAVQWSKSG
ncbi:alpha1,3-fucosyltransferase [Aphelenchoides avenae]|nr:alpha1,3-fucosyltransferase [Aphelenchus avenae]